MQREPYEDEYQDDRKDDEEDRQRGRKRRRRQGHGRPDGPDQQEFRCRQCRRMVGLHSVDASGLIHGTTQRNHCPYCLHSRHLDHRPGDRQSECGSLMDAIAIWVRRDGEWALLHRCRGCGVIHSNRIAPDDNEILLLSLAARPLGRPAFPLDAPPPE